jgi:hypothetical protein
MSDILDNYFTEEQKRFNNNIKTVFSVHLQNPHTTFRNTTNSLIKTLTTYSKSFYKTKQQFNVPEPISNCKVQKVIDKLLSKNAFRYKTIEPRIYERKKRKYDSLQRDIIDRQILIRENLFVAPEQRQLYKSLVMQDKYMGGCKFRNNLLQSVNDYHSKLMKHSNLRGHVIEGIRSVSSIQLFKVNFFKEINNEIDGNEPDSEKNKSQLYECISTRKKEHLRPMSIPINKLGLEDRLKKWDEIVERSKLLVKTRKTNLEKTKKKFELIMKNEPIKSKSI